MEAVGTVSVAVYLGSERLLVTMNKVFQKDSSNLARRTVLRVAKELGVLVFLGAFFYSAYSSAIPLWVKYTLMAALVAYIVVGLMLYPKARAIAEKFSVEISDDHLKFFSNETTGVFLLKDLAVEKVLEKGNKINVLHLRTVDGKLLKLEGMKNMDELVSLIKEGIDGRNS